MTQTELMVAMLEAGNQTQMDKRAPRDRVAICCGRIRGGSIARVETGRIATNFFFS